MKQTYIITDWDLEPVEKYRDLTFESFGAGHQFLESQPDYCDDQYLVTDLSELEF